MHEETEKLEKAEWDGIASWWDGRMGDQHGDRWHRTLLDPALLDVVGDVEGQRVLDLACGTGHLSRRLASQGARVTGLDASAEMIRHAREREQRVQDSLDESDVEGAANRAKIDFQCGDAARLENFDERTFDTVVVSMALMDIKDADQAISEAARVLHSGGRLVASLKHPCFDTGSENSAWIIESFPYQDRVYRKVGRYRNLFEHYALWRVGPEENRGAETLTTTYYHRPLSWYFRVFRDSGLAVTAFEEPAPTEGFYEVSKQARYFEDVPLHCIIEARKLPA